MKNGIVVIGATFVDIKGYPLSQYIPAGRNSGRVVQVHGGVCRNIAEDIANIELRPTLVSVVDHSGISTDVIEKLNKHQCNTRFIRRTEDGLGTWLAVFDNSG
ncbi:MAG: carbohydrate kinase family protein, partial [Lachnospiraceae bacterium]|nr:carbohydrate kinase family protein [Lachnospiraceae bacterium]